MRIRTFVVYGGPDRRPLVFVKDGFSWFGFFFPCLAALRFRLFGLFALLLLYHALVCSVWGLFGFPLGGCVFFLVLAHVFTGVALFDLVQKKLEARGARIVDIVLACSAVEAQLHYYRRFEFLRSGSGRGCVGRRTEAELTSAVVPPSH